MRLTLSIGSRLSVLLASHREATYRLARPFEAAFRGFTLAAAEAPIFAIFTKENILARRRLPQERRRACRSAFLSHRELGWRAEPQRRTLVSQGSGQSVRLGT